MDLIDVRYDSDLVDQFMSTLPANEQVMVERLIRRHIGVNWDSDAVFGPILNGLRTYISVAMLPRQVSLRIWWRDLRPVCSVLHLGFRPSQADDWEDLI